MPDPEKPHTWPPRTPKPGHLHLHLHRRNVPEWIIAALDAEAERQQISRAELIENLLTEWAKGQS